MPQPVPKTKKNLSKEKKKKPIRINKYVRNHPQYGTSKLEEKFAKEFLDVLGLSYQYQFEAKDIKRFFDFLVEGIVLIEIDGDYYHSYGKLYEDMNPMQKRNFRVDMIKDSWAAENGYILCRIWEHDIRNNPDVVMKKIKDVLDIKDKKKKRDGRH